MTGLEGSNLDDQVKGLGIGQEPVTWMTRSKGFDRGALGAKDGVVIGVLLGSVLLCCGEVLRAMFCDVFGFCFLVCCCFCVLGGLWCYSVLLHGWCSGFVGLCCVCVSCVFGLKVLSVSGAKSSLELTWF